MVPLILLVELEVIFEVVEKPAQVLVIMGVTWPGNVLIGIGSVSDHAGNKFPTSCPF